MLKEGARSGRRCLPTPKSRIKYPPNALTHFNLHPFPGNTLLHLTCGCTDNSPRPVKDLKSGEVSDPHLFSAEKGRCENAEEGINNLLRVGDANTAFVSYFIRDVRKRAGLTQQEFADWIGYHKNQVSNAETGRYKPSNRFLASVGEKLMVSVDWLRAGEADERDPVDDRLIKWLRKILKELESLELRLGWTDPAVFSQASLHVGSFGAALFFLWCAILRRGIDPRRVAIAYVSRNVFVE